MSCCPECRKYLDSEQRFLHSNKIRLLSMGLSGRRQRRPDSALGAARMRGMEENPSESPQTQESVAPAKTLTLTDKVFAMLFCVTAVVGLLGLDLAVWALPGVIGLAVIFKIVLYYWRVRP